MNEEKVITMPMIPLRGMVIQPGEVIHFDVKRKRSLDAINEAVGKEQKLFLVLQKEIETEVPEKEQLYSMGIVAGIEQVAKLTNTIVRVFVQGIHKATLNKIAKTEPYMEAEITYVEEEPLQILSVEEMEAKKRCLREKFLEYVIRSGKQAKENAQEIYELEDLTEMMEQIIAGLDLPYKISQQILEETNGDQRYDLLLKTLTEETKVLLVREEIEEKVKKEIDQNQREYLLREEMKVIREELGDDTTVSDAEEFEQAVEKLQASDEVKEKIRKEIKRFKSSLNSPAESGVIRTYIETMLEMPWDKMSKDSVDLPFAKKILDDEHYGLQEVKDRVLEFLAVRALTEKGNSPIICLVGPPGTGKTSIARSLAKALDKEYVRISLGGVHDEAEIRGHRKTYVGAMPGRIASALKSAGVKNPLMLLDEIDKVSTDYKGDTFSALLEVLDSEQNVKFRDHYLEVPIDLSEVLFVTTANTLQTIPRPLLDRMEIIEVNSYTDNEKYHIAERHLIRKQLKKHGLTEEQLSFSKGAIWKISRNYTKEAGVRQLERYIGEICRKSAREIFEGKKKNVKITESNLSKYLGREKYSYEMINKTDEVGIVRGLAWTCVGGDTLSIEVNVMPGKGNMLLTGQMGDVMKESAQTGLSYIRSIAEEYGVSGKYFEEHDIHIHIPEGAVPKDGPSAGITMATANLSAITNKKVRADVAMTGEITLRGRVLPIGGLKEKLLAAKNAGVKTVIVPKENEKDVEEITAEITKGLEIIPVSDMKEVLDIAIVKDKE